MCFLTFDCFMTSVGEIPVATGGRRIKGISLLKRRTNERKISKEWIDFFCKQPFRGGTEFKNGFEKSKQLVTCY